MHPQEVDDQGEPKELGRAPLALDGILQVAFEPALIRRIQAGVEFISKNGEVQASGRGYVTRLKDDLHALSAGSRQL
jgi:hypothetical protein